MNILFWLYKSRINLRGLCPIMLRITHKGKRINVVTGIEIEPIVKDFYWDNSFCRNTQGDINLWKLQLQA
jgi:hypothetical protein